jgi:hypothetical protein
MERVKPIVVQTFDVVAAAEELFATAAASPFLHPVLHRQHLPQSG